MDYKNWFAFKGNVELKALDKKAAASGFCLPHIVAEYARADKLKCCAFKNSKISINHFSDKRMAQERCQPKRIKNSIRSTMKKDLLNNLLIISMKDHWKQVASDKNRRTEVIKKYKYESSLKEK